MCCVGVPGGGFPVDFRGQYTALVGTGVRSSTLPVTVYEPVRADCEEGIHISLLLEQASIMDIDIKFPLIV